MVEAGWLLAVAVAMLSVVGCRGGEKKERLDGEATGIIQEVAT